MDWILVGFLCVGCFCLGCLFTNHVLWRGLKRKNEALSREIHDNIQQSNERWKQFNRDLAAELEEGRR